MNDSSRPRHISESFPNILGSPDPTIKEKANAIDSANELADLTNLIEEASQEERKGNELSSEAIDRLKTAHLAAKAEQQGRQ
ncbi:MAG: hypothetical protein WCO19_01285 [Candidatus Saccharibacteria bacterium]